MTAPSQSVDSNIRGNGKKPIPEMAAGKAVTLFVDSFEGLLE
jgi:hypothetical protein